MWNPQKNLPLELGLAELRHEMTRDRLGEKNVTPVAHVVADDIYRHRFEAEDARAEEWGT